MHLLKRAFMVGILGLTITLGLVHVRALAEEPAAKPPEVLSGTEVFKRMLPSTCWVRLEYKKNGVPWAQWGTAWVCDRERKLVLTNEHVIHGQDDVNGYFPQSVDGELMHEPDWYLKTGKKFSGKVIDRSTALDLALIRLEGLPEDAVELKLADKSPLPGERVFAIAGLPNGSSGLWIMTTGEVRQVYRRMHANGHYAQIVETQLPTNGGNSGGAVVNDRLEVVAVVEGERTDGRLVSMFIDVGEVRRFLNESVPLANPTTAEEFERRGSRRFDEARYDRAIEDYSAALKLEPKHAQTLTNRGWAYLEKDDVETAKADFNAALAVNPEMRGAYEGRGTCYREMKKYEEAIRDLTEAIRRDADDADAYFRRSKCYEAQGDYAKTLKDRTRAVELEPTSYDYLVGRAQTYRQLKNFDAAVKDFYAATTANTARADGYYEVGIMFVDKEDYPQAKFFFDAAMQRDKTVPEYVYMRGMSSFRMKDYAGAIPDINQAIALTRDRPHYYWNLGLALWNLDRFPEAAQAYSEYIRLKPDEPKGYSERADVYEAMGRNDLAEKDRGTANRLKNAKD